MNMGHAVENTEEAHKGSAGFSATCLTTGRIYAASASDLGLAMWQDRHILSADDDPGGHVWQRPRITTSDRAHTMLQQLKRKLLRAALEESPDGPLYKHLCNAAQQTANSAWATPQPLLVFPCLFQEAVQKVRSDSRREAGHV
jgi:hypothetical protein